MLTLFHLLAFFTLSLYLQLFTLPTSREVDGDVSRPVIWIYTLTTTAGVQVPRFQKSETSAMPDADTDRHREEQARTKRSNRPATLTLPYFTSTNS